MNYVYETGNNGQLRLNHAHMREKNTHTRENNGHIICISNNNHFLPAWHLIAGLIYLKFHLQKVWRKKYVQVRLEHRERDRNLMSFAPFSLQKLKRMNWLLHITYWPINQVHFTETSAIIMF